MNISDISVIRSDKCGLMKGADAFILHEFAGKMPKSVMMLVLVFARPCAWAP